MMLVQVRVRDRKSSGVGPFRSPTSTGGRRGTVHRKKRRANRCTVTLSNHAEFRSRIFVVYELLFIPFVDYFHVFFLFGRTKRDARLCQSVCRPTSINTSICIASNIAKCR